MIPTYCPCGEQLIDGTCATCQPLYVEMQPHAVQPVTVQVVNRVTPEPSVCVPVASTDRPQGTADQDAVRQESKTNELTTYDCLAMGMFSQIL